MPKFYDTHYEDDDQQWDTIILTKDKNKKTNLENKTENNIKENTELPLYRRIFLGRQRSKFTANQLASILRISLKEYEDIENNRLAPSKACLSKLRKYIDI